MPTKTEWVEPELYLEHNDVYVFYLYKNDEIEQGTRTYCFTLDPSVGELDDRWGEVLVDVRDFPDFQDGSYLIRDEVIRAFIIDLIDRGIIVRDDDSFPKSDRLSAHIVKEKIGV